MRRKNIYNKNIILFWFIVLILIGKLVRYTIMKSTLVDNGIGHFFLNDILNLRDLKFGFYKEGTSSEAGGNTIIIFKLMNIFNLQTYIQFEIYITILWNMIVLYTLSKVKRKLFFNELIFLCISIIVLNIFDFTLAKEPIQMLFFVLIFMVLISKYIKKKFKLLISILIIIFSAFFFRIYYLLIAFFIIVVWFIINKEKNNVNTIKKKDFFIYIFIIAIIYFIFLIICRYIKPSEYLELIRVRTRVGGAKTDMLNILPGTESNLILFTIDYVLMILRMLFPLELIPLGIKYLPYVGYQIMITISLAKSLKNIKKNNEIVNIALAIYIGFLFGSAAFEPDFGSWIRHEAVLFPIFVIMLNLHKNRIEG